MAATEAEREEDRGLGKKREVKGVILLSIMAVGNGYRAILALSVAN